MREKHSSQYVGVGMCSWNKSFVKEYPPYNGYATFYAINRFHRCKRTVSVYIFPFLKKDCVSSVTFNSLFGSIYSLYCMVMREIMLCLTVDGILGLSDLGICVGTSRSCSDSLQPSPQPPLPPKEWWTSWNEGCPGNSSFQIFSWIGRVTTLYHLLVPYLFNNTSC